MSLNKLGLIIIENGLNVISFSIPYRPLLIKMIKEERDWTDRLSFSNVYGTVENKINKLLNYKLLNDSTLTIENMIALDLSKQS